MLIPACLPRPSVYLAPPLALSLFSTERMWGDGGGGGEEMVEEGGGEKESQRGEKQADGGKLEEAVRGGGWGGHPQQMTD